jgi:DNA-binding response OmpR family regulator
MPGMSGRELADRFRQLRTGATVLFMSGFPGEITAGPPPGDHHITKPFGPEELAARVRVILSEQRT